MDLEVKEGNIPNEQAESCKHLLTAVPCEYKLGLGGAQLAFCCPWSGSGKDA